MSHLLHVTRLPSKALQKKGTVPLMVEYTVPEATAPYLVSSSTSVMWILEAHPGGVVKAAVRDVPLGMFFGEVVEAVAAMGRQQDWGNVQPLTVAGLRAAIEHVASYELEPLELLIPRAHPRGMQPATVLVEEAAEEDSNVVLRVSPVTLMPPDLRPLIESSGLPFRPCAWLPEGTIVVVPKDRTFVGVVNQVTGKMIAGVVHNAARGMGIVQGGVSDDLAGESLPESDAG